MTDKPQRITVKMLASELEISMDLMRAVLRRTGIHSKIHQLPSEQAGWARYHYNRRPGWGTTEAEEQFNINWRVILTLGKELGIGTRHGLYMVFSDGEMAQIVARYNRPKAKRKRRPCPVFLNPQQWEALTLAAEAKGVSRSAILYEIVAPELNIV